MGPNTGESNTGTNNAFFGQGAGFANTTGGENSFFGSEAGEKNTTGEGNSFFGELAGAENKSGFANSFFGVGAGADNTTGNDNTFLGFSTGSSNTRGSRNTFIGRDAGFTGANANGNDDTVVGHAAKISAGLSNSTAIGAGAKATASHTVVLGTDQEVVIVQGKLEVDTLGNAGNQHLCINNANRLAPCSSSLRYKTDLRPFAAGMSIINRLQPVSFTWKDGGMRDLGFGAEDVEKIEPLLVTYNSQGKVEGVKYDRITVALVNALKEQQTEIEELESIKAENAQLKVQLADLLARL